MFKKGQIVNLKNIFTISLVLIALVAVVLFFNKTTGFVWGIDSAKDSSGTATVSSEDLEITIGGEVIGVFRDDIGTLAISKPDIYNRQYFVRIENSQTSYEPDYGTDVVIEADRDSIRYTLNGNPLSKNLFFTLMSQKFVIGKIVNNNSLYLNGKLVKDGDAFTGEDLDNPNWVWELERLTSNNPVIGVENDFVMNDPSDIPSPPKVGECIYLPYNYASICLDNKLVTVDGKVKAKVSVKFKGQSTTTTEALTKQQKQEVLEMLRRCGSNYIHGKDVKRIFNKEFATGDDLCKESGSDKICVMVGTRNPDNDYGDTYYDGVSCDDPIVHSNSQFMGMALCCSAK